MNLVTAFVEFTADTKKFDAATERVKKNLTAMKPHFDALQSLATKAFFGLAGAAVFAAKAFGDAEQDESRLRAALEAQAEQAQENTKHVTDLAAAMDKLKGKSIAKNAVPDMKAGQPAAGGGGAAAANKDIDATMDRLSKFASAMQLLTVYDDDAIKGVMAFAANLGVAQQHLEGVTKLGVGLAQKYFGGDLKAGVEAASMAYNGNFRALQKLVPGLKDAKGAQEKWNLVVAAGKGGFKQAEAEANTFNGSLKQLWGQVGNCAEQVGAVFVPYIKQAAQWLQAVALRFQQLTPVQTQQIVKWAGIAAAIAATIAFGPRIFSMLATTTSMLLTVGKVLLSVGQSMIAGLFTPVGLIVAGFALLATGFAYLIGSGDNFVDRTINGFMQIAEFLDHLLGSWEGFKQGVMLVGSQMWSFLLEGFYYWKNAILNGWEYVAEFIEQVWWHTFEGMYTVWQWLKTGAEQFINWLTNAWSNMTDGLGDALYDAYAAVSDFVSGKSDAEKAADKKYLADMRQKEAAAKAKEYNGAQDKLDDEYKFKTDAMHKAMQQQRADDKAKRQGNRDANDKEGDATLGYIEQMRQKQLQDDLEQLKSMPRLSDKIKEAWAVLEKKIGLADSLDAFKGLQDELNKLKEQAGKEVGDIKAPGSPKTKGLDADELAKKGGKSIEDAFKENLRRQLIGATLINREEEKRKKEADDKKKADEAAKKAAADAAKAAQNQANAADANTKALTDLNKTLADGVVATFA